MDFDNCWPKLKTSRERHKSAPYLGLKIAKGHESVKKLKVSNSRKTQTTELARQGILSHFLTSIVAKHQKIEGDTLVKIFFESLTAENTQREYLLAPLSFLVDVKILLRKLSKNCKNCKIVRNVRKVDHSQ